MIEKQNDILEVSPKRHKLHQEAYKNMKKAAKKMQKNASAINGDLEEGDIIQMGLHKVDQTKVDGKNLTGVVVQVLRSGMVQVACKNVVLNRAYSCHCISCVPGASNNRALMGLEDAFNDWQGMPCITKLEAARDMSVAGGQGNGNIKCKCRGDCTSNCCKCFLANLYCTSKCHCGNNKCCNHE